MGRGGLTLRRSGIPESIRLLFFVEFILLFLFFGVNVTVLMRTFSESFHGTTSNKIVKIFLVGSVKER